MQAAEIGIVEYIKTWSPSFTSPEATKTTTQLLRKGKGKRQRLDTLAQEKGRPAARNGLDSVERQNRMGPEGPS
jgi:hypothetical protein